jgi:pyruvate, water dikinase
MFTRSPTDRRQVGDHHRGRLGPGQRGGLAARSRPTAGCVGKITGEISVRDISDKHIRHVPEAGGGIDEVPPTRTRAARAVPDRRAAAGAARGRAAVERHYGKPQDIEWALDEAGALFLLQSRPETVWSAKDAAPVARPAADPKRM